MEAEALVEGQAAQEVQEDQEYQEEAAELEEAPWEASVVPHTEEEESWGGTHQQSSTVIAPKRTPL